MPKSENRLVAARPQCRADRIRRRVQIQAHIIRQGIDQIEKRLWERLGLSVDPQVDYDLALTGDTVGTGAGTISLRVRFCAGC
jgi:hypothetical protein